MTRPEPKCIQWKRQGAERVAAQIAHLSREEELEFWRQKTEQLLARQAHYRQLNVETSHPQIPPISAPAATLLRNNSNP